MSEQASERAARVARTGRRTHHRMVGLTVKTAVAAGIAWQVGVMLPSYLPTYSYYAPLGALTVMYSALYDSAVQGLRALSAVTVGVLVSVLLHLAEGPNALTVAIALGVGTVLGNLRRLGEQGSWVPIAALFVFTAGRADTVEYVVGYLSQLLLGAVVGLVVNIVVFPPLALHEVERATRAIRRDMVRVLDVLVDFIDAEDSTIDERADMLVKALAPLPETRQRLRRATAQAERAQHGNPRRRRWQGSRTDVLALAGASETASGAVENMAREMVEERPPLRGTERASLSAATAALRDVIAQSREGVPAADLVRRANELLDDSVPEGAPFAVQRATAGLRRCLRTATGWID